jgi:lipopolysaccharide transport system ATP-binding protein
MSNVIAPPSGQSDISIQVSGVSKSYKVYDKPSDLLAEIFLMKTRHRLHHAVHDVSFSMRKGEVVGIVGANGAGKSTLLKMIAGTLNPTSGEINIRGKVSAILELGTGFNPEYSGRENVYLGGMCLGMSREEIEKKFDWIVAFSELEHAIDQPFKTYSSGMQARLTFATAIAIEPEILIIDEALAAGDSYFVVKCGQRIRELCESGATVLFVSHSTYQVATLCQRAVWIDNGRVREIGDAIDVCRHYDYAVHERLSAGEGKVLIADKGAGASAAIRGAGPLKAGPQARKDMTGSRPPAVPGVSSPNMVPPTLSTLPPSAEIEGLATLHDEVFVKGPVRISRISFLDVNGEPVEKPRHFEPFSIRVHYVCDTPDAIDATLGLTVAAERESDLMRVFQINTVNPRLDSELAAYDSQPFRRMPGKVGVMEAHFPNLELLAGDYLLSIGLKPNVPGNNEFYEYHHRRFRMTLLRTGYPSEAVLYPAVSWTHLVQKT